MQNKIMNFNQFSRVYESNSYLTEEEAAAPPKDNAETSVVSDDGSIGVQPSEILDLLKELGGKEEPGSEEVPNESLVEQEGVNTLKVASVGEKSDRVKEIQKLLGLEADGSFGQKTKEAVMKFQTEMKKKDSKIVVDGIVGVQTYGLMLKAKKGITDSNQLAKMLDKFKSQGKTVVSVAPAGKNIALDPRLYEVFEKIEIITNNGTTYVVATPKQDSAAKIAQLKKAGLIGADFSWLLAVPAAVGKAIVYTAIGAVVVQVEIAKAMVNAAISAGAYVGQKSMAVASNIAYGVAQIGNWVKAKGVQAWATLKQDAASAMAAWAGFNQKSKEVLKSSAQGLVAFSAAVAASIAKEAQAIRAVTHKMAIDAGKALNLAWEQTKTLGELVKTGLSKVKDGAQSLATKVQTAYDTAVARTNAIGNAVEAGFKKAGQDVTNALKSSVTAAGDALISAGNWVKGLAESAEYGNGELVLEWLEY
jgi:peptidoglycan hydrolase-like protein with peptidoglycan-binding domain